MLISHRKRFIYTKTVKTAGTSVESYFEPLCMRDGEWSFSHARKEYVSEAGVVGIRTGEPLEIQRALWWNHMPAQAIRALIGDGVWNDYFKFCVVRNPFDAMVSAYRYFHATNERKRGLRRYLAVIGARVGPAREERDLKSKFEEWLRTTELPLDRNKYLMEGEYCMDFVIRYEALGDGVREVCRRLDYPFDPSRIPHLKNSERPKLPISAYYSAAAIDIMEGAFRFELDQFGYRRPW
jgi:Sulfotransferase family